MANRIDTKNDGKLDKFNRQDAAAAINYISETLTSARSQPKQIDDLIVSLSNAHENRRARQVTEWEQMRQSCTLPLV
jgi:hypothetical protein